MSHPLLFLVFNRLDTTSEVFKRISEYRPNKLYIASDGARENKTGEKKFVQDVRDFILSEIKWECEVKTLFRERNLGCKLAVSEAISWFFKHEEMGIILEDDCLPDISFFQYCEELLERYKDDSRIFCISGNNFTSHSKQARDSYYFSSFPHIWGWATWRRAWANYDLQMNDWPDFKKNRLLKLSNYSFGTKRYLENVFESAYHNRINTWDYQWVYSCIKNNGLTIIPRVNLVNNIGFDDRATHTTNEPSFSTKSYNLDFPLVHPSIVITNSHLDKLTAEKHFSLGFVPYTKLYIKKLFREFFS